MKALLLPVIPPPHTSFGKHRFNSDLSRFSLNLSGLNPPSRRPSLGSPYLSPPMSGSPPPTDPLTSPLTQSRRRRRSESQPYAAVGAPVAPSITHEPGSSGRVSGQLGEHFQGARSVQSSPSFEFGRGVAGGVGRTSTGGESLPALVTTTQERVPSTLQRPQTGQTRRTKAHVASACVNCKKKHLRCDQKRPCLRCVQAGKEETCVDVQHKKRGRPPLRPGDSPSNTFSSGPSRSQQSLNPSYLSPSEDQALRGQRASLRPIRPGTGTQSPGSGDAGHAPRYPQPYPWQSSPSSTAATTSPTYSFTSASTRPFSAAPSMPDPSFYSPSYGPPSGGYAPMDVPRSYPQQASYFPQTQAFPFPQFSAPQYPYGGGYQPTTRSPTRPPIGEPVARETPRYSPAYPGPQLPPLQLGAAEQAQRQAQQLRPEQFQGMPQTQQQQAQHPPEQTSRSGTRQREVEEEGDPSERASKRRRGMKIGEILGER